MRWRRAGRRRDIVVTRVGGRAARGPGRERKEEERERGERERKQESAKSQPANERTRRPPS
eukprot:scaffold42615_cov37-Tisochrysis_lutea.AAC.3